jgi:hypothetical protein
MLTLPRVVAQRSAMRNTSLRLTPELYAQLEAKAQQTGLKPAQIARMALSHAFKNFEFGPHLRVSDDLTKVDPTKEAGK